MVKFRGQPAILHVDADAFFASCEQALHPEYRGRPVITGLERGIVAAASYEAKRLGINRGISLRDVKKICPQAIIVPSDYESYSLFSRRMFAIIRRYTPEVEEYSIDEAFANISGMCRALNMGYSEIAAAVKENIEKELGITVSVGLASSKVLAKVGSKWQKPSGLVIIPGSEIPDYLSKLEVGNVWGIGPRTAAFLQKYQIKTAYDFICKSEDWIKYYLTKPLREVWMELKGQSVFAVETNEKESYASVQKFKTFTPPSVDKSFVWAQLFKNVENAFIKLRRYGLAARKLTVLLRIHNNEGFFKTKGLSAELSRPTPYPADVSEITRSLFEKLYIPGIKYRATGITLNDLQSAGALQMTLFEAPIILNRMGKIYEAADLLAAKYGKHSLFLGAAFAAYSRPARHGQRGPAIPGRSLRRAGQINKRKFLGIPYLQ